MPDGCPERLDFEFLLWSWNFPTRSRPKVLSLLESHRARKHVMYLTTGREVRAFVANLELAR
jgi:hypothetical protein